MAARAIIRAAFRWVAEIIECMASSAELPLLGCRVGLKNYAAAYCTG
eukprot:CAMPEP_0204386052 /NCGR_PEP_ID=MMETSP0469-20131031/58130_1 /ASSEMBLY_ACC=CAM_ASM_000384 /TAXON_ID=2969 /ORGANISM="Oxyrrhis marina" /LENGTH=46 /DNA_ID= /DNA_START= /DNA_END= /DNA_ORIENTATION=